MKPDWILVIRRSSPQSWNAKTYPNRHHYFPSFLLALTLDGQLGVCIANSTVDLCRTSGIENGLLFQDD